MKVVSGVQVRDALTMEACIEVVEAAMVEYSAGRAICPLRTKIDLPRAPNLLGVMYGSLERPEVFGAKVVSIYPGNFATGAHSHQGTVLLFDAESGAPVAAVDAAEITSIRTAAASAVATRHLARPESRTLAILGYGAQAVEHLRAMRLVAPIDTVRVWGRDHGRATEFASRYHGDAELTVEVANDVRAAIEGADIVCTVTAAPEPIVHGDWLEPGQHINAVGTSLPPHRELDGGAVARSIVVVDAEEGARSQAGEIVLAVAEGAIGPDHIAAEIGQVVSGDRPGRTAPEDITMYKSLGLIVQDLASAYYVATTVA